MAASMICSTDSWGTMLERPCVMVADSSNISNTSITDHHEMMINNSTSADFQYDHHHLRYSSSYNNYLQASPVFDTLPAPGLLLLDDGSSPSSSSLVDAPNNIYNYLLFFDRGSVLSDSYADPDDDYLLHQGYHDFSSPLPSTSHADSFYAAGRYLVDPDLCTAYVDGAAFGPSRLLFPTANASGELVPLSEYFPEAVHDQLLSGESRASLQPAPEPVLGLQCAAGGYTTTTGSSGGCAPSAQSVAARRRRKRISEKTQELGELVPGGGRMNTAEMLHSAFNYVKFLQAQAAMLRLMQQYYYSLQEQQQQQLGDPPLILSALLRSPAMQEKLAGAGWCVVPTSMVGALLNDNEIKSHPSIRSDLLGLTSSTG